jgi:outer membrane protein TolC
LAAAELTRSNVRHGRLPSLSATAEAGVSSTHDREQSGDEVLQGLGETARPYWAISSNFSVPLGNRSARGEAASAASDVHIRQNELEELTRSVSSNLQAQVRMLMSSAQRVSLAEANVRLAEATLRAEEERVREGVRIHKDALEARNGVAQARAAAIKARIDYRLAQVELLHVQGQLTVELP